MQQLYQLLTQSEGMYLGYLIPIAYFFSILLRLILVNVQQRGVKVADLFTAAAMLTIAVDFSRYLYLLFSQTGKILPFHLLFIKYALGLGCWLIVLWYGYRMHFSRRAAGNNFGARWRLLLLVCVGSSVLGILGGWLF